ncbi:MAG: SDR family NAD(P)-dependent oxidoreductase, partial [bacterium]
MKTLVITGGSRGIGRETARLFQDNGYAVINLSRSTPQLTNIAHIAVDLSSPESLERHQTELDQLLGDAGEITLIHNAGLMQKNSVRNVTTEALQRSLNVNLVSPSRINQLVLPHMKAGSSILYVGSTLSEKAVANTASYVAAKHGLIGLMRSTCQDLAGSGIHTACVCPGFTDT